jgi:hypothetical protein
MNTISVPVSLGEAFDKLSILDIKCQRINSQEKLAKIQKEKEALFSTLRDHFTSKEINTLYGQLLYVNSLLWDVEDFLRDYETRNDTGSSRFTQHAREVYVLNDRRAEVKRAIDNLLGSLLQEVKSYAPYKKGKLLLLPHMGLGDMIILNGFIRYKALFHTEVRVAVFKKYADSIRFMFRDLNNITYEEVLCEADISPNYAMVIPKRLSDLVEVEGYEYLPLGVHGRDALWQTRAYDFAECFYVQGGVPYEVRRRFGYIMRDLDTERTFAERVKGAIGGTTYRILHDDPERNLLINHSKLAPGSPFFHVATKTISGVDVFSNNIFDYCTLIDNSEEYHGMDSSFALMLDLIRCKCPSINIHAYVKRDIHAKLYPSININFVGEAQRICRPIIIEKVGADSLVATITDIIKVNPDATHIVAVEKGFNVGDVAAFLTFREPIVWSDYASIAIGAHCVVFPITHFGKPINARNTWHMLNDPCLGE